jgi:hypothetical protein
MPSLPEAIISVLSLFASLFSKPVWGHVQVLLTGAILCQGPHTVAAILRVMGLAGSWTFHKYHRVLSRAKWSGLRCENPARAIGRLGADSRGTAAAGDR